MRILIDFTQIPVQKSGVGVYAVNLIAKLYECDSGNYYWILTQDDEDSLRYINNSRFRVIKVNSMFFRAFIFRILLEQIYIPYLVIKFRIDAVHSLHYSFPIFLPAKKIVSVHDMALFKFPQKHLIIKTYYFRFFIYLSSMFADKIITDSRSTLKDYLSRYKINTKKICTIYLGKSDLFNHFLPKDRVDYVINKYRLKKEYLLFMGTIEPRKNVRSLILAYQKLLNEDYGYQLVIAGKRVWYFNDVFNLIKELKMSEKVIFTGFVDEKDKPFLISGAKIFIYPSLYEGFGIPVLEAISCGVPTITSNISSLPEVAADAALLINPLDTEELYLAIKRLSDDLALCTQLRQKAIKQSEKFSWEKTAQETIGVYNSLGN